MTGYVKTMLSRAGQPDTLPAPLHPIGKWVHPGAVSRPEESAGETVSVPPASARHVDSIPNAPARPAGPSHIGEAENRLAPAQRDEPESRSEFDRVAEPARREPEPRPPRLEPSAPSREPSVASPAPVEQVVTRETPRVVTVPAPRAETVRTVLIDRVKPPNPEISPSSTTLAPGDRESSTPGPDLAGLDRRMKALLDQGARVLRTRGAESGKAPRTLTPIRPSGGLWRAVPSEPRRAPTAAPAPRLVIGRLTVEVVPSAAQATVQPPRRRVRQSFSPTDDGSRGSVLRFGLGQL